MGVAVFAEFRSIQLMMPSPRGGRPRSREMPRTCRSMSSSVTSAAAGHRTQFRASSTRRTRLSALARSSSRSRRMGHCRDEGGGVEIPPASEDRAGSRDDRGPAARIEDEGGSKRAVSRLGCLVEALETRAGPRTPRRRSDGCTLPCRSIPGVRRANVARDPPLARRKPSGNPVPLQSRTLQKRPAGSGS